MIDFKTSDVRASLADLGLCGEVAPPDPRFVQHMEVLANAMSIHIERTEVRGDTWAQFDHHDCIHHLSSKLARCKSAAQGLAQATSPHAEEVDEALVDKLIAAIVDDALDMINYSAFLVRHLTGRRPVILDPDTNEVV